MQFLLAACLGDETLNGGGINGVEGISVRRSELIRRSRDKCRPTVAFLRER